MYRDSVGNVYRSLPPKKPNPSAKPSKGGVRKIGRNRQKCERYRIQGRREQNKARRAVREQRRLSRRQGEIRVAA